MTPAQPHAVALAALAALTFTAVGCAHRGHAHHDGDRHMADHFRAPEQSAEVWNTKERDAWQKPEEIIAAMQIEPGMTLVDLGAGTGYMLPWLVTAAGDTGKVIAADVSSEMLRYLTEMIREKGWKNATTHEAKYESPALADDTVDRLVTVNTWHHIEQREAYAALLYRAMRKGGLVVVVDFLAEPTEGFGPPLEMRLKAEQVASELSAGGFATEIISESLPRHYIVVAKRR